MDLFASNTLLFLLSFIGWCAAGDILPEGPVVATLGKSVTITTLLQNPQYTFIIWNFNSPDVSNNIGTVGPSSLNVKDAYKGRVKLNNTNGYLTLDGLKMEDSGDYGISVVGLDGGTTSDEIKLQVLEPVSEVKMTSNMAEAIELNSTVVLTCTAKGSLVQFAWLVGSKPVVADGKRITVKNEAQKSTLTIAGILRTDVVGPFICTAANKLQMEKSDAVNVTVFYGPEKVAITSKNTPKFVRAKSPFNLTCTAVSSPPATFAWYRNQKAMEAAGPTLDLDVIEKHGFGSTAGNYTCQAKNAKTLRVVISPAVSFTVMDAIVGAKISGPTEVLLAGNSSANLSCMATSGSVTTVSWLKDGKPLSASPPRLMFGANMTSLMIKPLQKQDNGVYVCQLTNPVNTDKASYKMVVNYGPEPAMVSGETAVEVNDMVKLTCSAASMPPASFTWLFNNTMTPVKTAQYDIEMARYKNTGTYKCSAYNNVTGKTTTYTHTLSVNEEGSLDGLSDGAIAGIVIAILVALGAAIALVVYCRQKVPVESPY